MLAQEFIMVEVAFDELALVVARLRLCLGEIGAAYAELVSMTCGGSVP